LQFIARESTETAQLLEELQKPMFELVHLTEHLLLEHLKRFPLDATVTADRRGAQ
jgi:hypothetical protein